MEPASDCQRVTSTYAERMDLRIRTPADDPPSDASGLCDNGHRQPLESNTDLTRQDKEVTEHVAQLTEEIHELLPRRT